MVFLGLSAYFCSKSTRDWRPVATSTSMTRVHDGLPCAAITYSFLPSELRTGDVSSPRTGTRRDALNRSPPAPVSRTQTPFMSRVPAAEYARRRPSADQLSDSSSPVSLDLKTSRRPVVTSTTAMCRGPDAVTTPFLPSSRTVKGCPHFLPAGTFPRGSP